MLIPIDTLLVCCRHAHPDLFSMLYSLDIQLKKRMDLDVMFMRLWFENTLRNAGKKYKYDRSRYLAFYANKLCSHSIALTRVVALWTFQYYPLLLTLYSDATIPQPLFDHFFQCLVEKEDIELLQLLHIFLCYDIVGAKGRVFFLPIVSPYLLNLIKDRRYDDDDAVYYNVSYPELPFERIRMRSANRRHAGGTLVPLEDAKKLAKLTYKEVEDYRRHMERVEERWVFLRTTLRHKPTDFEQWFSEYCTHAGTTNTTTRRELYMAKALFEHNLHLLIAPLYSSAINPFLFNG